MNGQAPIPDDPVTLEGFGPQDLYQRREKIFTRYIGGFYQKLGFNLTEQVNEELYKLEPDDIHMIMQL